MIKTTAMAFADSFCIPSDCKKTDKIAQQIKNEIIDLGYIQDKKEKIETTITKVEFKGFEIYIGKNNKQNDYLISKIATNEDLWFHGQNFPSSHVILKIPNNKS